MRIEQNIEERRKFFDCLLGHYILDFSETLTLETNEDFIYLSNPNTYELYLINVVNPGKIAKTWDNYKGKKCYEVLQNRTEPCPFCTNSFLNQDQYYIWKHHNEVLDADYILKDKLIEWNGELVRMEVVIDISNPDRTDQVLRRSLDGQNILMSNIKLLSEVGDLKDAVKRLIVKVCLFFGAESGFLEIFSEEDMVISWNKTRESYYITAYPKISEELLEHWSSLLNGGKQIIIKNLDQIRPEDQYLKDKMIKDGTSSICITPIFSGKRLLGILGVKNIKKYWTELSILNMLGNHIAVRLVKEELQRENARILYYDQTTGYLNFEGFKKMAEFILKSNPHRKYALWYSDLKKFKYINDTCGYEIGDKVLRHWADFIEESKREYETFGRITGDKFVVLRGYEKKEELDRRFEEICRKIELLTAEFGTFRAEIACGAYLMEQPEDRLSLNEMIDRANMAEKYIKNKPGSNMAIYDEKMRSKVVRELQMKSSFMEALKKNEFQMYLQPQLSLREEEWLYAEALVRWIREDGTIIYPEEFINVFERDGMIPHLDHYMFEQACGYIKKWKENYKQPLKISVNVSRVTMLQADFVDTYCRLKSTYGISDGSIVLEFTEGIVVENHVMFQDIVRKLRDRGFLCAMDDFGTNQSSLNVLKAISMDILKLDRRFLEDKEKVERRDAVLKCIIQMASELNMETVAEGVETEEMAKSLYDMGCDYIQGYVYSKPLSTDRYEAFILSQ